jgi:gamma-glutamyltranspeptidase / glutathione hydrolase
MGSPGSSRITSTVRQIVIDTIDLEMPVTEAVAAPRLHHQWWPDEVVMERGFPADRIRGLTALGHKVEIGPLMGSAQSIAVTPQGLVGAADVRALGATAAGY